MLHRRPVRDVRPAQAVPRDPAPGHPIPERSSSLAESLSSDLGAAAKDDQHLETGAADWADSICNCNLASTVGSSALSLQTTVQGEGTYATRNQRRRRAHSSNRGVIYALPPTVAPPRNHGSPGAVLYHPNADDNTEHPPIRALFLQVIRTHPMGTGLIPV